MESFSESLLAYANNNQQGTVSFYKIITCDKAYVNVIYYGVFFSCSFKLKVSLDGDRYTWYRDTNGRRTFTANKGAKSML